MGGRIALALALCLSAGQAHAQAQIIWSERAVQLVMEYCDVAGKAATQTVTQYAVTEWLKSWYGKKPAKTDTKAVEDVVNKMSNDQPYLEKHQQAREFIAYQKAWDKCTAENVGNNDDDTLTKAVNMACSAVIHSDYLTDNDIAAAYDRFCRLYVGKAKMLVEYCTKAIDLYQESESKSIYYYKLGEAYEDLGLKKGLLTTIGRHLRSTGQTQTTTTRFMR